MVVKNDFEIQVESKTYLANSFEELDLCFESTTFDQLSYTATVSDQYLSQYW